MVWLAAVRFLGCWSDRELSRDAALGLDFFFVGVTRLGFAATDALLGFCVVVAGFCVVVGEDGFFEVFAASSTSLTGMSVGDFVEVGVPRRPTGSTAIVGNPESLRARSSTVTILRKQPLFHVFPKADQRSVDDCGESTAVCFLAQSCDLFVHGEGVL